jgi:hypothetical protein
MLLPINNCVNNPGEGLFDKISPIWRNPSNGTLPKIIIFVLFVIVKLIS